MKRIVVLWLLIGLAAGGYWYYFLHHKPLPSGFIATNGRLVLGQVEVASLYPGRVESIVVSEGQSVKKGELLASLSSEQIKANLLEAQAAKYRIEQTVHRSEAELQIRKKQLALAELEWKNAKRMRKDGLISSVELVRRQTAYEAEQAGVKAAQAAYAEAEAGVAQAQAKIQEIMSTDKEYTLVAPMDARVEYRIATLGSVIPAGGKVISLVDPSDVYMHIFLPTQTLGKIHLHDEVRLVLDGIDAVFPATITFISATSQFTPKFVETSKERDKLMYKVRVQFARDIAKQYRPFLKGGATGEVYLRINTEKEWPSPWKVKWPK